jgi:hypothetical protein
MIYFGTIIQANALGGSVTPLHYMAPIVPFFGIPLSFFASSILDKFKAVPFHERMIDVFSKKDGSLKTFLTGTVLVGLAVTAIGWSLLLSIQGNLRQGDIYMRSAAQESPILQIARTGFSFWPHYMSPNRDNGSLGVPTSNQWIEESNGVWRTSLSQGFRSAGAYTAELSIKSNATAIAKLKFIIKERSGDGLSFIAQETFEVSPNETIHAVIPFQLYITNEVAWFLESPDAKEIEIIASDLQVIGPERPSGYSDLGYTLMFLSLLTLVYMKQIRLSRVKRTY